MYLMGLLFKGTTTFIILIKVSLCGGIPAILYLILTYKDKLMENIFKQDMLKKILGRFKKGDINE